MQAWTGLHCRRSVWIVSEESFPTPPSFCTRTMLGTPSLLSFSVLLSVYNPFKNLYFFSSSSFLPRGNILDSGPARVCFQQQRNQYLIVTLSGIHVTPQWSYFNIFGYYPSLLRVTISIIGNLCFHPFPISMVLCGFQLDFHSAQVSGWVASGWTICQGCLAVPWWPGYRRYNDQPAARALYFGSRRQSCQASLSFRCCSLGTTHWPWSGSVGFSQVLNTKCRPHIPGWSDTERKANHLDDGSFHEVRWLTGLVFYWLPLG